eukprot:scaffold1347_cov350-Pavlova_lutheri.AAC.56
MKLLLVCPHANLVYRDEHLPSRVKIKEELPICMYSWDAISTLKICARDAWKCLYSQTCLQGISRLPLWSELWLAR